MSGNTALHTLGVSALAAALIGILLQPSELSAEAVGSRAVFVGRASANGYLIGIDRQWNLKFQIADKVTVVPAADLVFWGAYRDRETGPQIVLARGGVVRADVLEIGAKTVIVGDSTGLGRCLWDESQLPRSAVAGIMLQPPADAISRDQLIERIQAHQGVDDQLLLTSGESVSGRLEVAPRGGRLQPDKEGGSEGFQLAWMGAVERLKVPAAKVVAVVLGGAAALPKEPDGRVVQLGFRDGSLLNAKQVTADGDAVEIDLVGGGTLVAPADQPDEIAPTFWRQITWVQPESDRLVYLSDLKPIGYKHIPLLTLDWPYGQDRNALGGRLRSGDNVYGKGLGMHTVSRLAYELDGNFRRLEAELSLDDAAGVRGSVIFKVLVERKSNEWSAAYESPVVRGGDKPLPISVDVKDARRLALIVDYADRADEQDHANWLMARLIR